MEQRRWFGYYIETNNTTTELPTRTVRTNSALVERASDGRDPRDPPSKSGNLLGTWAIRADMPGTRRIIGTINHRWHGTSFERSYLFNFLDRHVVRFFPASLAVFLSPQLGNGNENCAICLEALVVGVEDIWCSLVSPSPIIIRSSTCSLILRTPP